MTCMPGNSRGNTSEERIKYVEQKMNLVQVIGVAKDLVRWETCAYQ